MTLRQQSTSTPVSDGAILPLDSNGFSIGFHETGAATGSCDTYTPDCKTFASNSPRLVNHLGTTVQAATQSALNGNYPVGNVFGKDSNGNAVELPVIDDGNSNTTGPLGSFNISSPGTYTFSNTAIINSPCGMQPTSVVTSVKLQFQSTAINKNLGCGASPQAKVSDPCDVTIGNFYLPETDYSSKTLAITRYYNSLSVVNEGLGVGWSTSFHRHLEVFGNTLQVRRGDARAEPFVKANGVWVGDPDTEIAITQDATGYTVTATNGDAERYDLSGKIQTVSASNGQVWTWTYDPGSGRLTSVTDAFGSALGFQYGSNGLLSTIVLPGGSTIQYGYDSNLNLTGVTYPDASTRQYLYENTAGGTVNELTGVIDEAGKRYATIAYTNFLVTSVQHPAGADNVALSYGNLSTTVTDSLSVARNYTYQVILNARKITGISGTTCLQCGNTKSLGYDAQGNINSRFDFNNNQTVYTYDLARNLELSRTEANGTARARTISTQWNATWRKPSLITEPGRTTGFIYDAGGNVLTRTVTDTATNVTRSWTYTYDSFGHVLTQKNPRTDVNDTTTYTYYPCSSGYQCGQVHVRTDSSGKATTYLSYNAHGQPLTLTDPNGTSITLVYDARQRLISRQVGSETTAYTYWPTGLLKQVTQPDGSYLLYTYDDAHRLNMVSDAAGNSLQYTLDPMGNRTGESAYDPAANLRRTHARVFNSYGEVYQDKNASGTVAATTTYMYDGNGNQTSIGAPVARTTALQYDEFNRVKQMTDAASGVSNYSYDGHDNLVSVTDPRSLTTTYTRDGFDEITQIVSPDTGTSARTYDLSGNLKSTTDARVATGAYTYDVLNRPTQLVYSDQTITYTYDQGTNGIGHLTGASDANHSMSWTYDPLGRVTGKTQVMISPAITKAITYGYTNGNQTSVTTPGSQLLGGTSTPVTYTYANHRISSVKIGTTTILSGVTYDPFGAVTGWTWGNGTTASRSYDQNGSPSQIIMAGVTNTYTVDDALRITGIADSGLSTNSFTFGYDALDRVTSGTSSAITRGYSYDANGNWIALTGTLHFAPSISPNSNQVVSTTGQQPYTFTYDPAGNTTGFGPTTYHYNKRGRIDVRTSGSVTTNYIYNALGEMIYKGPGGGVMMFLYDEAGHMVTQYGNSGSLIEETVWLNDVPVAVIKPSGSTAAIYYIHTDHLNTPRKVTRPADNGLMWRWDPDTYGNAQPNINPAGLGNFTYNLRFPGQYYMNESALHYNYNRTYNPQQGRYLESDPIGLNGGSNSTYSYAVDNPIRNADPSGLVKWTGEVYSLLGSGPVGGARLHFDLKSECIHGQYAYVYVNAAAGLAGLGAEITGGASSIEFDDGNPDLRPGALEGTFRIFSAGAAFGVGLGWAYIQLGDAFSLPTLRPEWSIGFDLSAVGGIGLSKISRTDIKQCSCSL